MLNSGPLTFGDPACDSDFLSDNTGFFFAQPQ